ncbi:MAG TPA: class I SAM-dependent methyltransferase [Methanoregula sp.]|nr:class I SAM-dependent methyltransferase [Methanoregula sp.]
MIPDSFFYQIFESLPRQGPGCSGATRKAWSFLPPIHKNAAVLDIGCGSGTQTRELASLTPGTIVAVDNHQPFLDTLVEKAGRDGTGWRIKTICASMDALPFEKGRFDLIWSEGAIFIIGFENGLKTWKPFLKKGGFMVVSDADWFEHNPPQELLQWWEKEGYVPASEDEMKERVNRAGLRLIATYRLPEAGWWDNYYVPMLARIAELKKTRGADPTCAAILDSLEEEAEMYRKYKRYYGYTFFVMQKV